MKANRTLWTMQVVLAAVLTPIAAGTLVIIMVGAVAIAAIGSNVAGAAFPLIVGVALVAVACGRALALSAPPNLGRPEFLPPAWAERSPETSAMSHARVRWWVGDGLR